MLWYFLSVQISRLESHGDFTLVVDAECDCLSDDERAFSLLFGVSFGEMDGDGKMSARIDARIIRPREDALGVVSWEVTAGVVGIGDWRGTSSGGGVAIGFAAHTVFQSPRIASCQRVRHRSSRRRPTFRRAAGCKMLSA